MAMGISVLVLNGMRICLNQRNPIGNTAEIHYSMLDDTYDEVT
jgi:hypothetical protein